MAMFIKVPSDQYSDRYINMHQIRSFKKTSNDLTIHFSETDSLVLTDNDEISRIFKLLIKHS